VVEHAVELPGLLHADELTHRLENLQLVGETLRGVDVPHALRGGSRRLRELAVGGCAEVGVARAEDDHHVLRDRDERGRGRVVGPEDPLCLAGADPHRLTRAERLAERVDLAGLQLDQPGPALAASRPAEVHERRARHAAEHEEILRADRGRRSRRLVPLSHLHVRIGERRASRRRRGRARRRA
jgi:hypothetical protein